MNGRVHEQLKQCKPSERPNIMQPNKEMVKSADRRTQRGSGKVKYLKLLNGFTS